MEYKRCIVHAPSKILENGALGFADGWDANCTCRRQKLRSFVTGANSAADTMLTAMAAINAGSSSANRVHKERY